MRLTRSLSALGTLLALGVALAACSPPAAAPATTSTPAGNTPAGSSTAAATAPAQPTTAPKATVEGGGEGGVESALVTYSDAAQGFAISHPGNWTQDTAVTQGVRFVGGDNSMTLEFVKPPSGTDAMTYAKNDVAAVSAAFPGFKQLSLAPSTEVQNAIILGYEATGTSTVTGKSFGAHDERYYMPLVDGRIAILTVAGPAANYDREGVRDIALTFKTTK
jgi:hypothetical protein